MLPFWRTLRVCLTIIGGLQTKPGSASYVNRHCINFSSLISEVNPIWREHLFASPSFLKKCRWIYELICILGQNRDWLTYLCVSGLQVRGNVQSVGCYYRQINRNRDVVSLWSGLFCENYQLTWLYAVPRITLRLLNKQEII